MKPSTINTYKHTYIQFICIALDNTDIVIPTALDSDLQLKLYTVKINILYS